MLVEAVRSSAALVDCGSGHTSVIFYSYDSATATARQHARSSIKQADGGNIPLTDVLLPSMEPEQKFAEFISKLKEALAGQEELLRPSILYVGATGGVRAAFESGKINEATVEAFRLALLTAFQEVPVVRFEVLPGKQEAALELSAAQIIWGAKSAAIFPSSQSQPLKSLSSASAPAASRPIGLFSGGGQSMQLGRVGQDPLSFPFSTFTAELEERDGAAADAWQDPVKWGRFTQSLTDKVAAEAARQEPFEGCYVGTSMNHRAALYCGLAETPLSAARAVEQLQAALPQLMEQKGPLYDKMMSTPHAPSYPLCRISAMHTFRLATVLRLMFAPQAQLYFAAKGAVAEGAEGEMPMDCEWTLGAFVREAAAAAAE